jgi:hypothetical protein
VNEIGAGVVPHSAPGKLFRGVAKGGARDIGEADVDGFSLKMKAPRGHPSSCGAKSIVRRPRAVPGDDVERSFGTGRGSQIVEQVEKSGIDRMDFAGSVVPKETAEPGEGLGQIPAVREIGNSEPLAGVGMEEGKDPLFPIPEGARGRRESEGGERC